MAIQRAYKDELHVKEVSVHMVDHVRFYLHLVSRGLLLFSPPGVP